MPIACPFPILVLQGPPGAGIRTFVAPLWNVSDATQQILMDRFYQELSTGKDRTESLRQAQLLRNPYNASFLQWAPVILSGDPDPIPKEVFAP